MVARYISYHEISKMFSSLPEMIDVACGLRGETERDG